MDPQQWLSKMLDFNFHKYPTLFEFIRTFYPTHFLRTHRYPISHSLYLSVSVIYLFVSTEFPDEIRFIKTVESCWKSMQKCYSYYSQYFRLLLLTIGEYVIQIGFHQMYHSMYFKNYFKPFRYDENEAQKSRCVTLLQLLLLAHL